MMRENEYTTLSHAIKELKKKGYTQKFRINLEGALETENGEIYLPREVNVAEVHQFETFQPHTYSMVYAVITEGGEKGLLIDAYGTRGGVKIASFLKKVPQPLE